MDLYPELPHYTGRKNQNRDWEGYVIIVYNNYDMEPASRTILVSVQTPTVHSSLQSLQRIFGAVASVRSVALVGLDSEVWSLRFGFL